MHSASSPSDPLPNVLILGGVGFIGRHFVKWLVDNKMARFIRVADCMYPTTAGLGAEDEVAFTHRSVEYRAANLNQPWSIAKAFSLEEGKQFTYVFNLAG